MQGIDLPTGFAVGSLSIDLAITDGVTHGLVHALRRFALFLKFSFSFSKSSIGRA